jgi:hypothetical protein
MSDDGCFAGSCRSVNEQIVWRVSMDDWKDRLPNLAVLPYLLTGLAGVYPDVSGDSDRNIPVRLKVS